MKAHTPSGQQDTKDDPYSSVGKASPPSRRTAAPPKPRLVDKLKFGKKKDKRQPRVDPKDRIYKKRLANKPNWDRLEIAQALFNFKGEMKCDLEFRKGQTIQIITKTDTTNDWWEGKLGDRVGIFPANYVKLVL